MSFGDLLDQLRHGATVVPRLAAAARRAGLGPRGTVEVLRISEAALRIAAGQGRGVPGRVNAMRHFMWQAVLAARFGIEAARTIAVAQEAGAPRRRDSMVDTHNNAVGQEYGVAHAAELEVGAPADALTMLVPVALEKWESDELIWVRPRS